ncbi:DUF424 domain-containing protein [Halobacteriales archaeon QH_7_66_36]|nr:MAG: DUF424 domain-containing protein [Halobacteriales archaeon QH_7_66_36]
MLLVERDTSEGLLVSVCDESDLGETFENGEVSITADPSFYDGEAVDAEAVTDALARCDVANIVGTESVRVAVEAGFVAEANVLDLDGTRHAQYLRL